MTRAYDELYLSHARVNMGNMLHAAVYLLGWPLEDFYDSFLESGYAARFGKGEPGVVAGRSGTELAMDVIYKTTGRYPDISSGPEMDKSPEYWAGWALAYYEWFRDIPFETINAAVPVLKVTDLYDPLHEADTMKFVDVIDRCMDDYMAKSRLARLREYAGLSQRLLAERSGVSRRMIEQYEQGKKDLSHASAETVYKLSRALGCDMEQLMI